MIYSDRTETECAFCGNKTTKTAQGYDCDICRARISRKVCEKTAKPYYTSEIIKYNSAFENSHMRVDGGSFLHDRCEEAQMHFRNITDIAGDEGIICPHCSGIHL